MEVLIEVKNLIKSYGNIAALDGLSFNVNSSECLGILGPNGAGKTTLAKIIQCISTYNEGEVKVMGIPAGIDERRIRASLGVIPQENDLDNDLTVFQNLILFSLFFDIKRKTAKERILELLSFVELIDRKDSLISELSGGMKRRLLVARALINNPKILVLDEPTTGLDPQARHAVWQRLRILKEKGITIILTTHYMDEAQQLCDRLLILDKGKILREGNPQNLIISDIGKEVIEIRNYKDSQEIFRIIDKFNVNYEEVGNTIYIYCNEYKNIIDSLMLDHNLSITRRLATLEDLFLKLTGRGLIE